MGFPFCRETLSVLGIPENKVFEVLDKTHLKAKSLICTSPTSITNNGRLPISQWIIDFLRSEFLPDTKEKNFPKRLWISRLDSKKRSLINEKDVIKFLEKMGFQSVILSSMSVAEQARVFNNADVIVAPHGAGLTNLVFCNPGTKVVEIFLPPTPEGRWSGTGNFCYLSNQLQLPYYYMISDEVPFSDSEVTSSNNNRRMLVNPDKLLDILRLADIQRIAEL